MARKQNMLIIGGGLSGLTLAYELSKRKIGCTILEASPRWGGRIETVTGIRGTPLELGATWFSEAHPNLLTLIAELGLQKFPQFSGGKSLFQTKSFEPPQQFYVPESESPSYRLAGGTQLLTDTLAGKLPARQLHVNARATAVTQTAAGMRIDLAEGGSMLGDKVVICLPPQLAFHTIEFVPSLPEAARVVMPAVQTWMAGAIKFTLEYSEPFWRNEGFSGMVYSHAGIVTEMYDHSNAEGTKYGFTGFLNSGAAQYSAADREMLVLQQLSDLLGAGAAHPLAYFDKVWDDDKLIAGKPTIQFPHQNNGHEVLQNGYMDDQLFFCNTETSTQYAGYMEGAVTAAKGMINRLVLSGQ